MKGKARQNLVALEGNWHTCVVKSGYYFNIIFSVLIIYIKMPVDTRSTSASESNPSQDLNEGGGTRPLFTPEEVGSLKALIPLLQQWTQGMVALPSTSNASNVVMVHNAATDSVGAAASTPTTSSTTTSTTASTTLPTLTTQLDILQKEVSKKRFLGTMVKFSGDKTYQDGTISVSLEEFEYELKRYAWHCSDEQLYVIAAENLVGKAKDIVVEAGTTRNCSWDSLKQTLAYTFPDMQNATIQLYGLKRKPGQSIREFINIINSKLRCRPDKERELHLSQILKAQLHEQAANYWSTLPHMPLEERIAAFEVEVEYQKEWGLATANLMKERETGRLSSRDGSNILGSYRPPTIAAAASAATTTAAMNTAPQRPPSNHRNRSRPYRRYFPGRCYHCNQPGHKRIQCRNKEIQQQQQQQQKNERDIVNATPPGQIATR